MEIDIEKLNRKTPYGEPSDDFFNQMQSNVISQTIGQDAVLVKKEAKVFSINFKWMAAAAVVLLGGITALFSLNDDTEGSVAQQSTIVDSVYRVEKPTQETSADVIAKKSNATETGNDIVTHKRTADDERLAIANTKAVASTRTDITDKQNYASGTKNKSAMDVEKVLAAFTPEQLKDIDRNSEQDVYLDLYN